MYIAFTFDSCLFGERMKIIFCCAIVVMSVFVCKPSRATTLVWQFPQIVGVRYDVRTFSRSSTQQNKPMVRFQMRFDAKTRKSVGKEQRYVLKSESTTLEVCNFSIDVLQRTSKGLKCRLTLRDWRMNLSEKEDGKPAKFWTAWNRSMSSAGKIVSGSSFTFVIGNDGRISDVRGLDFRRKLLVAAKAQGNTDWASLAESRFNADYWESFLNQFLAGSNTKRLAAGDRWQFKSAPTSISWLPLAILRVVTKLSSISTTVQDRAALDVDTTPRKNQNYRDTAIYAWKINGSYQNDWRLDWNENWRMQANALTLWHGNSQIFGASKQGALSLLSDTPMIFREEKRLVVTRIQ